MCENQRGGLSKAIKIQVRKSGCCSLGAQCKGHAGVAGMTISTL